MCACTDFRKNNYEKRKNIIMQQIPVLSVVHA